MKKLAFILSFVSIGAVASAQGFYSNGAIVSVTPNTILSVPDSLVNKGTLINNGDIQVAGAWINSGTYTAGAGAINFNSDLPQVINHNDQSVEKLTISGGGEKKFLANITVHASLTFDKGILVSENGARLIMDKSVNVTGASNASHVKGPVERIGSGDWIFPIGNGTTYLPVVVSGITDNSATGIISMRELAQGEKLTSSEEIENISAKRYWNFAFVGSSAKTAKIVLPVTIEDNLGNDATLWVVAGSTDNLGPYKSLGQSGSSPTSVVSNEGPTYSYLTVASLDGDRTIEVFNAVSAGNDGKNDFMTIRNIEYYPNNKVAIVNRWGDRVFEATGYDNSQNSFRGLSAKGEKLPAGTYYYTIDLGNGSALYTGFIAVK